MLDKKYLEKRAEYDEKVKSLKTTGMKFTSVSGEKIEPLYGPDDIENINYLNDIGFPGEYPFSVYPPVKTMRIPASLKLFFFNKVKITSLIFSFE